MQIPTKTQNTKKIDTFVRIDEGSQRTISTAESGTQRRVPMAEQSLKNAEVIELKQKELHERAFTTFCLDNWDEEQIDSLVELIRKNGKKFVPYCPCNGSQRDETDSYNREIQVLFVDPLSKEVPRKGLKKSDQLITLFQMMVV